MASSEYISREALKELFDGIYDCADLVFEPDDQICAKQHSSCGTCRWLETKRAIQKSVMSIHAADVRPRWTPATEQLPEEAGKYLVCGRWRGKPTEIWVCEFMTLGCLKGWANNAANPVVSHWMPLPEPPRGKADD